MIRPVPSLTTAVVLQLRVTVPPPTFGKRQHPIAACKVVATADVRRHLLPVPAAHVASQ